MKQNRDNSGSISKVAEKKNPKGPDYKGSATINGIDYWLAGWIKEYEGSSFLSLAFEVKKEQSRKNEDDIPF